MDKKDMHELRKNYIELKKSKLKFQRSLKNIRSGYAKDKTFYTNQIKSRRLEMLNNKELREEHGITNNKSWEQKIKDLTLNDEINMENLLKEKEDEIQSIEENVEDLNIDIENVKMELLINMEYKAVII